ncbi:MAG: uracil-DNA glycosylase [Balneolaceae bacterium]
MNRPDSLLNRLIDRLEFESSLAPDLPTTIQQSDMVARPDTDTESKRLLPEMCRTLEELETLCRDREELRTDLAGTRLVFGSGDPDAHIMIIGEAPGEEEDHQGVPFVGAAGELLTKILQAIELNRNDVYIANILKHRPPGNRNPSEEERQRSLPFLLQQIELVNPMLILALGRVASTTLLGTDATLKSLRGRIHPFGKRELMVTYHPAALLRNPSWKRPVWEDVQRLRKHYDERVATK